jgi:site-specific DNA-methyltransferase (adenine-specific)
MNIVLGDCFEIMKTIPHNSVDLILCDPPYGINYVDNIALCSKRSRGEFAELHPIQNDSRDDINWDEFFELSYNILKDRKMLYLCCRMDMIIHISDYIKRSKLRYVHDLIWHKGDMGYGNLNIMGTTHEFVIGLSKNAPEKSKPIMVDGVSKKRTPSFYSGKLSKKEYYNHPTQKPVGLMAYIILNRTDENDIILDPFSGVGSVAVAAKLLNRQSISVEIDKNYCELSKQRVDDVEHLSIYKNIINKNLISVRGGVTFNLEIA